MVTAAGMPNVTDIMINAESKSAMVFMGYPCLSSLIKAAMSVGDQ
jgi:hypothetical protein